MKPVLLCGGESILRVDLTVDEQAAWNNLSTSACLVIDLIDGTTIRMESNRYDVKRGGNRAIPMMVDASVVEALQIENDNLLDEVDDLSNALRDALKACAPNVRKRITTTLGGDWDE